ncbi:MAG: NAD(P)/FAD-dependent oxidoreductase [Betaproteobacteria bacterium]
MDDSEIVIVGGSCSGAAAGYVLSTAGKHVTIIEKTVFPREKLCGGMITEKTMNLLNAIYGNFNRSEIVDSEYSRYSIYHKEYGKICTYTNPGRKLFFVDRLVFDNFFLSKAELAGCKVIQGDKVDRINGNSIVLHSGKEIRANIIIGADGANSVVRKSVTSGIDKKRYSFGVEINVLYNDLTNIAKEKMTPRIYFGYVAGGYLWIFPKRDYVTFGIGGPVNHNKDKLVNILRDFVRGFVSPEKNIPMSRLKGHPVPLHNYLRKPYKDGLFLIGDAAGFVEPITGEGIFFAVLSGKLVAEAILCGHHLVKNYRNALRKNIYPILRQGYIARRFFFNRYIQRYAMYKMKNNAKYCKYYFDMLSLGRDYIEYAMLVVKDRNRYKCE